MVLGQSLIWPLRDFIMKVFPFRNALGAKRRLMRRLRRDERGSTAIEFAMLAIPFMSLIYAIFETSMVHVSGQVLQTAVTDASRKILTGQAQSGSWTQQKFKDEVCSRVKAMFDCKNLLQVDVRTVGSFDTAQIDGPPIDSGKNLDTSGFAFNPGGPKTINIVRAVIAYPIVVPLIGTSFVNLKGGKMLIMATAAFQTEPYAAPSSP
jgi:Flp pilus assembly protein TadG